MSFPKGSIPLSLSFPLFGPVWWIARYLELPKALAHLGRIHIAHPEPIPWFENAALAIESEHLPTVYHPAAKSDFAAGEIHGNGPSLGIFHGDLPTGLLAVYMVLPTPRPGTSSSGRGAGGEGAAAGGPHPNPFPEGEGLDRAPRLPPPDVPCATAGAGPRTVASSEAGAGLDVETSREGPEPGTGSAREAEKTPEPKAADRDVGL